MDRWTTESHFLAGHLHVAAFGRDLVLLDVRSGHYELLCGIAEAVEISPSGRRVSTDDTDLAEELAGLGLFSERATAAASLEHRQAMRSVDLGHGRPKKWRDWIWMGRGWGQVLCGFYGRAFSELLFRARRPPRRAPIAAPTEAAVARKAEVFNQLWIWTPFVGDCFYRCFMLLRLLGDDADAVDWIFGVRTWPFVAHCWLQFDDLVLTDPVESVALFSPILVA